MDNTDNHDTDEVELLSATEWSRWEAPAVVEPEPPAGSQPKRPAAKPKPELQQGTLAPEQIEKIREQAYQEGLQKGQADGYAEGMQQAAGNIEHLQQLLESLSQPLEQLDQEVTYQLVLLCSQIARAVVQQHVMVNPAQVVDVVRSALAVMPGSARNITVHVNPEDAEILREKLQQSEDQHWRLLEDPEIERGGCEVKSDSARIDQRLETRLAEVVEEVMSGATSGDSGEPGED